MREARRSACAPAEAARVLGHDYVGPEHLLLVLCRDPDTSALLARGA